MLVSRVVSYGKHHLRLAVLPKSAFRQGASKWAPISGEPPVGPPSPEHKLLRTRPSTDDARSHSPACQIARAPPPFRATPPTYTESQPT